ncbi:MAG TPA: superoxide dismutase family protein [Rhizomicrobium sp.]|nr:superoxide dismutase family protein [Rhizomicrobium sp.]
MSTIRKLTVGFLVTTLTAAMAVGPALAASGALKGNDGSAKGTVTVTGAPKGVVLRIEASGLTPGWHGAHFHEKGDCSDAKFTSAGSHVHGAVPKVVHGLLNPEANDSGDLPNIYVGADGKATVELYSSLVLLNTGGALPGLLDADGSALVIHAKPDDYKSQPIGGAGDRVACAVIR